MTWFRNYYKVNELNTDRGHFFDEQTRHFAGEDTAPDRYYMDGKGCKNLVFAIRRQRLLQRID